MALRDAEDNRCRLKTWQGWQMLANGGQRRKIPISRDGLPVLGNALVSMARRKEAM